MPRKANATIGTIPCPITGEVAAVRKERSGRLYLVSRAGKITPYTVTGQDWMVSNANIWAQGPPTGTPDWILKNRASPPDTGPDPTPALGPNTPEPATAPAGGPDPDAQNPEPDPDPDDDEPVGLFGL